jgi:hypothetical protein
MVGEKTFQLKLVEIKFWLFFNQVPTILDTTTILMTLLIMTILITLNMSDITYTDYTYK